jgi:hypothetical protein
MGQWDEAVVTMCVEMGAPGPGLRIDYVRTGKGIAVPRRFEAHFSSPGEPLKTLRLTIGVSLDGVLECAEVLIGTEPGAPAVARTDLQVPLKRLMVQAVAWIARPAEVDVAGNVVRLGARAATVGAAPAPRQPPREITADLLAEVADIYREAKRSKRFARPHPTQAVADNYLIPYDRAAKWVGRARDAGILEGGRKARGQIGSVRFSTEAPEKRGTRGRTAKSPFVPTERKSK